MHSKLETVEEDHREDPDNSLPNVPSNPLHGSDDEFEIIKFEIDFGASSTPANPTPSTMSGTTDSLPSTDEVPSLPVFHDEEDCNLVFSVEREMEEAREYVVALIASRLLNGKN